MKLSRRAATAVLAATVVSGGLTLTTGPAQAASLTEITSFGNNPGGMKMHVYVPDNRPSRPGIVVAMHGCGGSGPGFYSGSEFASLADRYGFVVIYPSATQQAGFGNCFDTWSAAAKTRGGGSDPVSIVSMIEYVERQYGGDPGRVYATGSSSGGMMTQHMLALYPDVFKAGASFMGVPFNCFENAADYAPGNSKCTGGSMNRTPQQWGDAVRQAYAYSGQRPPIQLWHGTADNLVPYSLLNESIEQWTNVFGLSQTPSSTDSPRSGWNRSRFRDSSGAVKVEAISVQGAGHSLPGSGMAAEAIAFFGLDRSSPTTTTTTTTTNPTTTTTTTPTTTTTSSVPGGNRTAGCGRAPSLQSGTRSITSSGMNRSYILRIPDGYDSNRAYKLIFGLHWLNGSAQNVDNDGYYGVRSLANNSAIFVAPQGINAGWANENNRDLTFIDDVRGQIENALCVDTSQRFSMGWSYGGSMSFALACARPEIFRAVAVYSGAQLSGCSGGTSPVAYLGIHGTNDSVLNISMGRQLRDKFVGLNGCQAQSPREPGAGQQPIKTQYSGCRAGYPVTWIAFSGDHVAPSFAGQETWSFFTGLPSTTTTTTTTTTTRPTTTTTTTQPTTTTTTTQPTTTTTTTRPTTTTTTTTTGGNGGACTATYRTIGQWPGGYQGEVTVTATGGALNGWVTRWTVPNGSITQWWGGELTASGSSVTVRNAAWNGTLAAGASATYGFLGNGTPGAPAVTCSTS